MILKSLGRKASATMTGARMKNPFMRLVRYMTRTDAGEQAQSVLWHGFYGYEGMSNEDIVREFEANAKHLKERRNGNVLYHEILSLSRGYTLEGEALTRALTDIGQEYLRYRAPNQMAFGAIHQDTKHIHLHLMVSANAIGKSERTWFTKQAFSELQKTLENYVLTKYPELAQTKVYDRPRHKERLKTQAHEQAMKSRTGEPSRKERMKSTLHQFFADAKNWDDLNERMNAHGMSFYTRGKSIGIVEREKDGGERRHRLTTLGLDVHYASTCTRLEIEKTKHKSEKSMTKKHPLEKGKDGFGFPPDPSAIEIVESELLTGQLHEMWHAKPPAEEKVYTDPILEKVKARERGQKDHDSIPPSNNPAQPSTKKQDERER